MLIDYEQINIEDWLSKVIDGKLVPLDLGSLNSLIKSITRNEIKTVSRTFSYNLDRTDDFSRLPFILSQYSDLFNYREQILLVSSEIGRYVERLKPISQNKELIDSREAKTIVDAMKNATENMQKVHNRLRKINPRDSISRYIKTSPSIVRLIEHTLQLAVTSYWSALETLSSDLWVASMNANPSAAIIDSEFENEVSGIHKRNIDLHVLKKYDYNLQGKIGSLLEPKFDFTSIENIIKAYRVAFGKTPPISDSLKKQLWYIEQCRHVVLHNAAIADKNFIQKTGSSFLEGEPIVFTMAEVASFGRTVLEAGVILIEQTLDWHAK